MSREFDDVFSRPFQPRFNGIHRTFQHIRKFFVGQTVNLAQNEELAHRRLQAGKEFCQQVPMLRCRHRCLAAREYECGPLGLRDRPQNCRLSPVVASQIETMIRRHPEEPCRKRGIASKAIQRLKRFYKYFLCRILRIVPVPQHAVAMAAHPRLVLVHQLGIGVRMAALNLRYNC